MPYVRGVGEVSFDRDAVIAVHIYNQQLGRELLEAHEEVRRLRKERADAANRSTMAALFGMGLAGIDGIYDPLFVVPYSPDKGKPYICPTCRGEGRLERLP